MSKEMLYCTINQENPNLENLTDRTSTTVQKRTHNDNQTSSQPHNDLQKGYVCAAAAAAATAAVAVQ